MRVGAWSCGAPVGGVMDAGPSNWTKMGQTSLVMSPSKANESEDRKKNTMKTLKMVEGSGCAQRSGCGPEADVRIFKINTV